MRGDGFGRLVARLDRHWRAWWAGSEGVSQPDRLPPRAATGGMVTLVDLHFTGDSSGASSVRTYRGGSDCGWHPSLRARPRARTSATANCWTT